MNEYQIALFVGACAFGAGVSAYIFSWIAQWAWAWIDDTEIDKKNWVSSNIRLHGWKHPVYNEGEAYLKKNGTEGLLPFGYAKDKKLNGCSVNNLKEGCDYIYRWRTPLGSYPCLVVASFFAPMVCLFAVTAYPITIGVLTVLLLAHLARFSRRHKKMFDEHIEDKNAHK